MARHHCMDGMSLRIFEVAGGKRENRLTGTKSALKQDTGWPAPVFPRGWDERCYELREPG